MLKKKRILSNKVKDIRAAKGWTQSKLSEESGIDETEISQIENCKRSISSERMHILTNALGCTISELLGESDYRAQAKEEIEEELLQKIMTIVKQRAADKGYSITRVQFTKAVMLIYDDIIRQKDKYKTIDSSIVDNVVSLKNYRER
jgi:transcriptional regulator with XRE-family HTH domain